MEKKLFLLLLIAFILLISGCARDKQPADTQDFGPGDHDFSLVHDGLTRIYKVHVPPSYDKKTSISVVLNFHGGGGNAEGAMKQTKMNEKSDNAGFIVVYPQGTGKTLLGKIFGTWNAGRCCGYAKENNVDDVGFVSALLDDLASKFNVDEIRIYATGHSNGALFSYRLACELTDRIAAIAPTAAHDAFDDCNPSRPISVMHFHGTADPAALYNGGHCGGKSGDEGWECTAVPKYIDGWKVLNNCLTESSVTYQNGSATCETFEPCDDSSEVTLCTIEGGGHTWPGGNYYKDTPAWKEAVGELSLDISANDSMWEFFKKHPLE